MKVFDFSDSRAYIRAWLKEQPKEGHGQFRKMAEFLNAQTSFVSQVMSGKRDFSDEHASLLAEFFSFTELEADYFLTLVQWEKSGHHRLRSQLARRLEKIRDQAQQIEHRISKERTLSDEARAIFYSQWYYSAIRLSTALPGNQSAQAIADHLKLPVSLVAQVLDFLLKEGLCLKKNGALTYGPKSTHIAADSLLVSRHHQNWRQKCMENFEGLASHEILFTGPAMIAKEDRIKVRTEILALIDSWAKIVDASGSEALTCLNIDWLDIA